jgi:hypothetical protein
LPSCWQDPANEPEEEEDVHAKSSAKADAGTRILRNTMATNPW